MNETASTGQEETYDDSPAGWAGRWTLEFAAARKALDGWHKTGDEIDKEFRGETKAQSVCDTRLCVFTANVQTMEALLYGQTPRVSVSRRFADAKDDAARVAGEMMERLLNQDICRDDDTYSQALRYCLSDRLLPGMASARVRYVAEFEKVKATAAIVDEATGVEIAAAVPETEKKSYEDAEVDYLHWKDQLWSPARVFSEVTWWAFKAQLTRAKLIERFGEEVGKAIPLNAKREDNAKDPWGRADVWEIWHKETKRVFWFVEGFPTTLDDKEDPLELDGFWPFPEPIFANLTTSKLVPRPDFALHQDSYRKINLLVTRIAELVDAVRVAGLYDEANGDIARMLTEQGRNKLIPVKNWAALSENGGIAGAVDWFPVDKVVQAIAVLQERLTVEMDLLYQVTGWSDILRGEATQAGATATEQRVKAKSGSVRIQKLQDEFARFASDLQRLRAQIIAKHFDIETIIERSNAQYAFDDPMLVQKAAELIKSDIHHYRIEVKPEAVALQDFAAVKQERMEVLQALTGFFQAMAPIVQMAPGSTPHLLEIGQWAVSGLRGASQIEGVFDRMIDAAEQQAQQPQAAAPSDPKLQAEQLKLQGQQAKGQADLQKEQLKHQLGMQRLSAEVQADAQREENQRASNVQEAAQKQVIANALKPQPTISPVPNGRPK